MIFHHNISLPFLYSHCSMEMMTAFTDLIGPQGYHDDLKIRHRFNMETAESAIAIYKKGRCIHTHRFPVIVDDTVRQRVIANLQANPALLLTMVSSDCVEFLKENAITQFTATLQKIREDNRVVKPTPALIQRIPMP